VSVTWAQLHVLVRRFLAGIEGRYLANFLNPVVLTTSAAAGYKGFVAAARLSIQKKRKFRKWWVFNAMPRASDTSL
jgi:hypothetical protein